MREGSLRAAASYSGLPGNRGATGPGLSLLNDMGLKTFTQSNAVLLRVS